MFSDVSTKFLVVLSIIATALAGGAFALSWQPSNHFFDFSPSNDGYVAPRNVSRLIEDTQNSTVVVLCDLAKNEQSLGTGWAIDRTLLKVHVRDTALITNYHVIKECTESPEKITVALLNEKEVAARVIAFDIDNDIAVLETKLEVKPLKLATYTPWPGYWVMALGSAAGYEGSVAFGNVLNTTSEDILITNNISEGNSGGALVDNEGNVIGMVTWGMDFKNDQYNGARILDVFCSSIIECAYESDGEKTWFEYSD